MIDFGCPIGLLLTIPEEQMKKLKTFLNDLIEIVSILKWLLQEVTKDRKPPFDIYV